MKVKDKEITNATFGLNSLIFGLGVGIILSLVLGEGSFITIMVSGFMLVSVFILMGFVELIKTNIKISRNNMGEKHE